MQPIGLLPKDVELKHKWNFILFLQTLIVATDEEGTVTKEVKVLDVDTISQAKEKILDSIYNNKPYSSRPSANQVSLGR